jgi:S-disulfanyl-L-cysteine oxidoreductase SoxD
MSSWAKAFGALLLLAGAAQAAETYPGIGRTATDKEVAAWDIDVRPDFKGLPKGSGSVNQGMALWETKCASCHGVFGESNEVFSPLVGGTTAEDVKTGRVARLTDRAYPGRTTLMKVPTLSTLWDYIRRAMPWTSPKSLSPDEVYALVAYMLNLGFVVPEDFVLSDANIAQVQQRLPNRNGMRTDHGLWPGKGIGNGGQPDVKATACMKDCATEPKVASLLPDFARNAHGNLAEQNRTVGAQHGADTSKPPGAAASTAAAAAPVARPAVPTAAPAPAALALLKQYNCLACHGVDKRIVGPAFTEVAKRYSGRADNAALLTAKISSGSSGSWGVIPMPAQAVPARDVETIVRWLNEGAAR